MFNDFIDIGRCVNMSRRKCSLNVVVEGEHFWSKKCLLLERDLGMFYFRMEMIDHRQDANEKHWVYYMTLHPRRERMKNKCSAVFFSSSTNEILFDNWNRKKMSCRIEHSTSMTKTWTVNNCYRTINDNLLKEKQNQQFHHVFQMPDKQITIHT